MPSSETMDFSALLPDYLNDCEEGFQRVSTALLALKKDCSQTEPLNEVFRAIHTLKSSSAMLGFPSIAELAHTCEDLLDCLRKRKAVVTQHTIEVLFEVVDKLETMVEQHTKGKGGEVDLQPLVEKMNRVASGRTLPGSEQTVNRAVTPTIERIKSVKVGIDVLDSIFDLVGELIITKNRISNIVSGTAGKELKAALAHLNHIVGELHEQTSAARLVPVDEIFRKFPRMVRDLARDAGKEIELIVQGGEIELDKAMLDAISEPLIHLLKNAVDHGIEPAETRLGLNKNRSGTVRLSASRTEQHTLIEVEDDGRGIDTAELKEVFVRRGIIKPEEVASMTDDAVVQLLFESGTSSAETVTSVSGRGVGLDVVRTSLKRLGGTVEVATEKARGTRFTLQLPLTTAVMQTLMVDVGTHVFAVPTDIVLETLEVRPQDIREIGGDRVLVLRQKAIPFARLNELLSIPDQDGDRTLIAVIVQIGGRFIGLGVDAVTDQMENIVKPFDSVAQRFKGFSGGTILGDGRVALLLDVPGLLDFESLSKERDAS